MNKEANIKICEVQKAARSLISDKLLFTVYLRPPPGTDSVLVSGALTASNFSTSISSTLESIEVSAASLSASASITGNAQIHAEPLLTPFCIDPTIQIDHQPIGLSEPNFAMSATVTTTPTPAGFDVNLRLNPAHVTLRFQRSPVASLLFAQRDNIGAFLRCSVPFGLVVVAEQLFPNDFMKKDLDAPAFNFSGSVASIDFSQLGVSGTIQPVNSATALGAVVTISK